MTEVPTIQTELRHMLRLILQEAHAWHAQDPDNEPFLVFAQELASGQLPTTESELFITLVLYGDAITRHPTTHPIYPLTDPNPHHD